MTTSHPLFEQATGRDHKNAAGSSQSAARDATERASGVAEQRRATIVALVRNAGLMGMTWKEVSTATGLPHQKVTPALSNLHQDGVLAALRHEKRNGCGLYVAPEFVKTRIVREFKPNRSNNTEAQRPRLTKEEADKVAQLRTALASPGQPQVVRLHRETVLLLLNAIRRLDR